ncbi:MAG TPA: hypothetical protein VGS96_07550 [Thermoanaerobaculia bacterium]|jgi:hypothetical protein|nr:hypothetical protein [Thermoanaerobaculia bacterium]
MKSRKSLLAGVVAVATFIGTSAFAESRHHQGTNRGSGGRIERGGSSRSGGSYQPRDRGTIQRFESRGDTRRVEPRGNIQRFESRDNTRRFESRDNARRFETRDNTRRFESRDNSRRFESRDNTRRFESRDRRGNTPRFDREIRNPSRGQRYNGYGRVDRFVRDRHGYRVWIGGGFYPIFVPFAHWRIHPLRVGLFIRFGGYWDPLGYWSVYDYAPYDGYRYYGRYDGAYTSGDIRGVVESVDFRRGTLVINDDISRQFVTVTMPRDRRMDDVRPGDYVEFSGDWTRGGVFNAYRLERLDEGRY